MARKQKQNAEILGLKPPSDEEAERALLGSLLLKPEIMPSLVERKLCGGDFYDERTRLLWQIASSLYGDGKPVDVKLIQPLIRERGDELSRSTIVLIAELIREQPTAANATHYLDRVRDVSAKRRMRFLGERLLEESTNGKSPGQSVEEALRVLNEITDSNLADQLHPLPFEKMNQQNQRLRPPVIHGLLRQGETANLISTSKAGKSWLMYHLALSIITNGRFLDHFDCLPGDVLLIDNELHQETIVFRVKTVADAMAVPLKQFQDQLSVLPLRGKLLDLYGVLAQLEKVKSGSLAAIIADSWYRLYPKGTNENDSGAITMLYNAVDREVERLQAVWINVHHSSKGSQSDKRVVDVGAGAGAQSRAVDAHLILREHEKPDCVVFDAAVRSFEPIAPFVLRWQFPLWIRDDKEDPQKLKGRQNERDAQGIAQLKKALRDGGPATNKQLKERTHMGFDRLTRLLDTLQDEGFIVSEVANISGNDCQQYRLTNESGQREF
jgi:hypothetical protein